MKPENARRIDDWQILDVVHEPLQVHLFRNVVLVLFSLSEEEFAVLVEQKVPHVLIQVGNNDSSIIRVRHSTAVHRLTYQILQ